MTTGTKTFENGAFDSLVSATVGLFSVIIPTFNSSMTLECCLDSLRKQTYGRLEVTVVDNFSSDKTKEICERFGVVLSSLHGERAAARNAGLAISKGTFIMTIDADMTLDPNLVSECVEILKGNPRTAIIIPEVDLFDTYWGRVFAFGRQLIATRDLEYGSPRAFHGQDLRAIDGWDANLIAGEDADLRLRLEAAGIQFTCSKYLIYHHVNGLTLKKLVKKAIYYRRTLPALYSKHGRRKLPSVSFIFLLRNNFSVFADSPVEAFGYTIVLLITSVINLLLFYRL